MSYKREEYNQDTGFGESDADRYPLREEDGAGYASGGGDSDGYSGYASGGSPGYISINYGYCPGDGHSYGCHYGASTDTSCNYGYTYFMPGNYRIYGEG